MTRASTDGVRFCRRVTTKEVLAARRTEGAALLASGSDMKGT